MPRNYLPDSLKCNANPLLALIMAIPTMLLMLPYMAFTLVTMLTLPPLLCFNSSVAAMKHIRTRVSSHVLPDAFVARLRINNVLSRVWAL